MMVQPPPWIQHSMLLSCAGLRSPHGTLLWSRVLVFVGSQRCLALDDASADLWEAVIEQKTVSLSQSFLGKEPRMFHQGSTSELHATWW